MLESTDDSRLYADIEAGLADLHMMQIAKESGYRLSARQAMKTVMAALRYGQLLERIQVPPAPLK